MMLLALRFIPISPVIAYAAVFVSSSLLYWVICRQTLHIEESAQGFIPLIMLLVLIRVSFVGMKPLGSDDVYRYVWDGRVQTAGFNPYRFAPEDEALRSLSTDELPLLVNHPQMKTIYFPLSQWLFYVGYHLSGERVWGFQVLILISEILTILGLLMLMRELSYSPWRVLIYAASPLAILQFSLDAHVDAFGFPFLVFALLFHHRKRMTLSLLLFGFSLLVKPVAFVILPIVFLHQRGLINKTKTILLPLTVLFIPFIPYSFNANPFEAFTTFAEHWMFNGAVFNILFPLFSDNQTTRLWSFFFLGITLLMLYLSKFSFHEKIVFAVLLLLLFSPVVHAWYVGWLIVLLPLAPISSGIAFAATASLTSITYAVYQLEGVWKDYPWVLVLEYLPVIALLVLEWRRKFRSSSSANHGG